MLEIPGLNMVGDRVNDQRTDLILVQPDKALMLKIDKSVDEYIMVQPFVIKLPKILGFLKQSNT